MSVQQVQDGTPDRLAMGTQGAAAITASDVVDIGEQARIAARAAENGS